MERIIDGRGTGKTLRLMKLAQEQNGVLVCSQPRAMEFKAHSYGLDGFEIISYNELISGIANPDNKPVFIDEVENFLQHLGHDICGYSLTNED